MMLGYTLQVIYKPVPCTNSRQGHITEHILENAITQGCRWHAYDVQDQVRFFYYHISSLVFFDTIKNV